VHPSGWSTLGVLYRFSYRGAGTADLTGGTLAAK